jgi:hypothetical protein
VRSDIVCRGVVNDRAKLVQVADDVSGDDGPY